MKIKKKLAFKRLADKKIESYQSFEMRVAFFDKKTILILQ